MIAQIEGIVASIEDRAAIIIVGGIGIRVYTTPETLSILHSAKELAQPARLFTHLAVREDALDLYGFLETDERSLFELVITIPGIGPKKALSIISIAPVATLKRAIINNDASYLTKVSGIGKKNAEKIVLELKDKIITLGGILEEASALHEDKDALAAMLALGYSHMEAREALKKIPAEITGLNNRIKEALKVIGK